MNEAVSFQYKTQEKKGTPTLNPNTIGVLGPNPKAVWTPNPKGPITVQAHKNLGQLQDPKEYNLNKFLVNCLNQFTPKKKKKFSKVC